MLARPVSLFTGVKGHFLPQVQTLTHLRTPFVLDLRPAAAYLRRVYLLQTLTLS